MKKFLTVLLALSVVFTYSFGTVGSAFAVSQQDLEEATAYAESMIEAVANSTKATEYADGTYEKSAVDQATADATNIGSRLANDLISLNTSGDTFNYDDFKADIDEWCGASSSGSHVGDDVESIAYAGDSYQDYFDSVIEGYDKTAKIADAKEKVNAVNAADYTDQKTISIEGRDYTHRQAVDVYKNNALEALDAVEDDGYANAITTILYGAGGSEDNPQDGGFFYYIDALTTVAEYDEENANAILDVEHAISELSYFANRTYYGAMKVTAGDDVSSRLTNNELYGVTPVDPSEVTAAEANAMNANLASNLADTLEVLTVYFNELDDKSQSNLTTKVEALEEYDDDSSSYAAFTTAIGNALEAKEFYEEVAAYGEDLKDEVTFSGAKMYNDADIDEAVAEARNVIYGAYDDTYDTDKTSYFDDVERIDDPVVVAINEAIDKWDDNIVYTGTNQTPEADKIYCKDYYAADWQSDYEKIRDAAIEKLTDVKTVEEVNQIMADAAADLAELRTAENDTAALRAAISQNKGALWQYAHEQLRLLNNNNITSDDIYRIASFNNRASDEITSAYEAGCELLDAVLTETEIPAAYAQAQALFNNIKTIEQLDAEATAVENAIAALPALASLDREADFQVAYDAYKAYLANYGAEKSDISGYLIFESKMTALKALQIAAVEEAIAAMDDDNVITRDELTAVENMYNDYVAYYEQYDETFDINSSSEQDLVDAQEEVWNDEVDAVRKLMAALTTDSSMDELTAAKEAYDALSGSQQRAVYEAYPYKVQLLEMKLALDEANLKLAIQGTHVKIWSSSGSGYIQIRWDQNDNGVTLDGYEVYRSTKKTTGFSKISTFMIQKQKTYKINMKKGTKYYFKVKGFKMVGDEKVYTHDSITVYRTFR